MVNPNDLKSRLFELESVSPERQERFRNELAQIIDPRLSRGHRLYYIGGLACILIGLPGAVCGALLDFEHRWIWVLNLAILMSFAAWIFYILKRGAEPFSMMAGISNGLTGIACVGAVLIIVIGIQTPSLSNIMWAILGLLFFVSTSFINLWNRMTASERTIREHFLRVEYCLARGEDVTRK